MKYFAISLMTVVLLFIGCSKDKPTQSTPTQQSLILLSELVVSIVPEGRDTVTVCSRDANGAYSEFTVSNSASDVASATLSDSTLQITGLSFGTANLTITNDAGKSIVLPVEVYDKNILDAGELLVAYTHTYETYLYRPFWVPVPPEGFFALGAMCSFDYPGDSIAVITVKPKPGSDAIAFTDSFICDPIYSSSLWRPIPPPGYKAMGFAYNNFGRPDSQACIREDLTIEAVIENAIFVDNENTWSLWKIETPYCGPHSRTYLAPGNFVAIRSINAPVDHPLANVLNVDLHLMSGARDPDFAPKLTGYSPPPMETMPTKERALLAPFTVIKDLASGFGWQLDNSPTYRVERQVIYKCLYHNYNQTDIIQNNSYEVSSGISSSQSETFRAQVGIAISAELGVSFSPAVSGKISSTVSFELGYERQTGITEFQETSRTTSLNIPPGKAGAIWQRFNRFTIYRHNGNTKEIVGTQDIGIDSYVTDVYPD